ncbi:MAG: QueT transporter family protein [Oscillospiraceae bacterium]
MKHLNGRAIAVSAMIAAVYTAVSLVLSLASFGVVQIRVAECLTLLPVLSPLGIYGVTIGCLLTNIVGVAMGLTMPVDILFGTLATSIAAVLSYLLRNVRIKRLAIPAALPPILINGLIIGLELTWLSGSFQWDVFWTCAVSVTLGQIIPCLVLGVLLVWVLEKKGLDQKLFGK